MTTEPEQAKRANLLDVSEQRSFASDTLELRAEADTLEFRGYASLFDTPYPAFGGPSGGGWTEMVDRRAFDKTLSEKPHVHMLINHAGLPLASTKSGTLRLTADSRGLKVDADLDPRDPDVQRLRVKMERRDMDEMSFSWRTKQQDWNNDYTERRILEASMHKGDVSVVNFGMNQEAGVASIRSMLDFLESADAEHVLAEVRTLDNPLDRLRELREHVDHLIREATPAEKRTLTLAEIEPLL